MLGGPVVHSRCRLPILFLEAVLPATPVSAGLAAALHDAVLKKREFACAPLQSVRPRSIMRSLLVFPKTPSAAPHVSALSLALPI